VSDQPVPNSDDPLGRWSRYPEYKDSSVEWLGPIPVDWQVKPLKHCVDVNRQVLAEDTHPDYLTHYIDISNVESTGRIVDIQEMPFEAAPSRARRRVQHGDTIISTVRTYLKAIAYMDDCSDNLIVSTGFAVLSPGTELTPKFLFYLVQSVGFVDAVVAHSEGVGYPAINPSRLGTLAVWTPSTGEQRDIADFLDRRTAKIDGLIAKKERLIDLLQEKRTAVISRAVTSGLDPNPPMKDSDIEWVGQIPAHWMIKRVKRLVSFRGGGTPSKAVLEYWQGDIPWVSPKDMKTEMIDDTEDHITAQAIADSATHPIEPGVVLLVVRSGILRHAIPVAINRRTMALNQDMKALIPGPEITAAYLKYLIVGHQAPLLVHWRKQGATVESIEHELLANSLIPLPSLPEQQAIADFLDIETAKIDALTAKVGEEIKNLKEYRSALISAAVTGKIDVRGAAS
jgi:type I restriction enzyme S subunit